MPDRAFGLLPTPLIEIAFTTAPGAAPVYVDVTSYLRSGTIARGRQNELGRYEAGTATLVMNNRTRAFDPTYAAGTFYPNVKPMKKLRISAVWNAVTYRLFTGFIESWPQSWPGNRDGVVNIAATDGFKVLGLAKLSGTVAEITGAVDNGAGLIRITAKAHGAVTGAVLVVAGVLGTTEANGTRTITVIDEDTFDLQGTTFVNAYAGFGVASTYPAQLSSARVTALLNAAAWPAADRSIETGVSTLQPTAYDKTDALSALQTVELSENGRLYIKGDGTLVFENRHTPYLSTSAFTFTGTHYQIPTVEYDDSQTWNQVITTRDGGVAQTVNDATSQTDNLIRTLERTGLTIDNDNEANDNATFLLAIYKDPALRIPALQFRAARTPATIWPALLARELGERVTVTVQPPAGGTAMSQVSFIEGFDHAFSASPTDWQTTLRLSAVGVPYLAYQSGQGFFILGDATLGKVGSTGNPRGVLAY